MGTPIAQADARFVPVPEARAAHYRRLRLWAGESLWDALLARAAKHPERIAVRDATTARNYAALVSRATDLARGLHAAGIAPGDAVLVQLDNCVAFFEVYFALFRLGARPIAAQVAHRRRELVHFVRATAAVAHVHPGAAGRFDFDALSRQVRRQCPTLCLSVGLRGAGSSGLQPFMRREGALPPLPDARDIALFQLSGGSTQVPKLIPRTHDDYLYSVRRSVQVCGFDGATRYLAALPVAHNFPLSSPGALGTLAAGGQVILSAAPTPQRAFPLLAMHDANVTALVPALLGPWLQAAARDAAPLGSLRLLQVGGAPLPIATARHVATTLGCRLQQVYGMAEGLVCYTDPDAPLEAVVDNQGRPMSPYDELRIEDDAGQPVQDGEPGHLLTRGPYTIAGYYGAPEHNRDAFTPDGFYRTGDLVMRRADGCLVVVGRAKDQVNRGGEKIAAPEVEAALCEHCAVQDAAIVGVPDAFLGERSWAFVVASEPVSTAALRAHLRAVGLSDYKLPDRIELVDALPKTAVGKVDKRTLRAKAAAPVAGPNPSEQAP